VIRYEEAIKKAYSKGKLPRLIFEQFHHAFQALDLTKDLGLFDVKTLKGDTGDNRHYFRLRKGKYRAIFYIENGDFFVISIAKRDEVYKKWL
jgi:mRNA interferase RelE/StbE